MLFRSQTIGATDVAAEWDGKDEPVVQDGKMMVRFTPALTGPAVVAQDFPFSVGETKNRDLNAGYWVDASDDGRGMTLANRGTMGYRWDGRTLYNILLYSGKYSWGEPHAFLDDAFTLEYCVAFHRGGWREGQTHRIGLEYNFPAVSLAGTPRKGYLRPSESGLALEQVGTGAACPNLVVSALYTRDGRAYIRLYEFLGFKRTSIRMTLGGRPVGLIPVNLLHEEAGEQLEAVEIPAFGIKTYRLAIEHDPTRTT